MSIQEIESAIAQLKPDEVATLSAWLADFEAESWDRQIEADSNGGKLDRLLAQANSEFEAGHAKPL